MTEPTYTREQKLREALLEVENYFDNRADADHDETGFVPNEEMRLLVVVRDALARSTEPHKCEMSGAIVPPAPERAL